MTTSNRHILKHYDDLYDYCAKPNFLATAHRTIIFLLPISQIFDHCKPTNYFTIGNRLNIWLLCIEILYYNFKKPILKQFIDSYGYLAKPNFIGYYAPYNYFPLAHFPIICLLQTDLLFHHWKSSTYLFTVHRKIL